MRLAILALQWLIRLCAVVQVVLGGLFWAGNAYPLLPVHMLTGIVLVLGLWVQAGIAVRAGSGFGVGALAFGWGLVVIGLGMTQDSLLPGDLGAGLLRLRASRDAQRSATTQLCSGLARRPGVADG